MTEKHTADVEVCRHPRRRKDNGRGKGSGAPPWVRGGLFVHGSLSGSTKGPGLTFQPRISELAAIINTEGSWVAHL